ncbi:MAG: hypothetical protein LBK58_11650 [Prevotellaceae bacterium]|jgi:hypothetical protein|nr:hypothetical protein [Prevotellaceae bacterium]
MERKFNHGVKVRCKITGLEGIVTGYCDYITGCAQYLVQPPAKDGEYKDSHWLDEGRLETTGEGIVITEQEVRQDKTGFGKSAPVK